MDLLSGDLMNNEDVPALPVQRSPHWRLFKLESGNWKMILPERRSILAALSISFLPRVAG